MDIDRIKEFWPDWNIGRLIGEGSYGRVYEAEKNDSGITTKCAVKIISVPTSNAEYEALRSEGMTESESKTYLEDIVNDFANEIKLMSALKGAPHIVSVEDYKILSKTDRVGWNIYIRMELLESFKDYSERVTVDEQEVIRLGIEIASALEICERDHIIHRDIKPANIFVSRFGEYKLGDFGVAKELEKTGSVMSSKGTYSYMAPEVAKGLRYDPSVDIYSLGIVMYTLLNNNRHPFVDPYATQINYNMRREANEKRLSGLSFGAPCNASPELANVILTACAYDPTKRFKSASAFKNALLSCRENMPHKAVNKPDIDATISASGTTARLNFEHTTESAGVREQIVENASQNNYNALPREKTRKKGLIIGLCIVLLIAIVGISLLFADNARDNNAALESEPDYPRHEPEIEDTEPVLDTSNEEDQSPDTTYADTSEPSEDRAEVLAEGKAGDVNWRIEGGKLYISGNGVMPDYNNTSNLSPWSEYSKEISELVVEKGVKGIGSYAFYNFKELISVSFPDSLISIGHSCFKFCDSIEAIELPDSLQVIGPEAFEYTSGFDKIILGKNVREIGEKAFCLSHDIEYFYVDPENEYFTAYDGILYDHDKSTLIAFPISKEASSVTIPHGVRYISRNAFTGCDLTKIVLPSTVREIGNSAFSSSSSLERITLPEGLSSIGAYTFSHCDGLTQVMIPDSVTYIDEKAFDNCPNVTFLCSVGSYAEDFAVENDIEYIN